MVDILKNTIMDLDNLLEYYESQYNYIISHITSELPKYKKGLIINKLFGSLFNKSESSITEKERKIVDDILSEYKLVEDDTELVINYKLRDNNINNKYLDPEYSRNMVYRLIEQPSILGSSSLMMLMVIYENAIAELYRALVTKYPSAYLNDKSISFSKLLSIQSNIEEIKKVFINNEVESFMHLSITDWYRTFENKHKAIFLFKENEMELFKEVYYRRNVLVHNQGIVNEVYLKNVKSEYREGELLRVDSEYFKNAITYTIMVLYSTFYGMRSIMKSDKSLENTMFNHGYNYMVNGQWKISCFIFWLLMQNETQSNADYMYNKINYWISVKNSNGFDSIREEVESLVY